MTIVRRLSAIFLCLFSFAFVQTTSAQTSLYGGVMMTVFGLTGANYGNGSFKPHTAGFTGGGFYTFPSASRFKAGIDGRISFSPGYNGGGAYTGAFRMSFVPNKNRLRPYFQIGGGAASTQLQQVNCSGTCTLTIGRVTNGVVQIDFGLDIRLTPQLDIRAADYGADAGAANGTAKAAVSFLNVGVVYHFNPGKVSRP